MSFEKLPEFVDGECLQETENLKAVAGYKEGTEDQRIFIVLKDKKGLLSEYQPDGMGGDIDSLLGVLPPECVYEGAPAFRILYTSGNHDQLPDLLKRIEVIKAR